MSLVKSLLWFTVNVFFSIFFIIFGKPKAQKNLQKTMKLYEGDGFNELFSVIRVWDAPYEEINKLVPRSGKVIDLGSGDGILANYLALSSSKRKVVGVEINKNRISEADKGVENAKFKYGDILKQKLPKSDCILLTHVLHHLPSKRDQEIALRNIKKSLKKNGKLIIVEIVEKPRLKYWFTWLTDAFTVPILFEGKLYDFNFHYRKENEWLYLLNDMGFKIKTTNPHFGKPFSHVIFSCELK